jgi:hypothetical protein
MEEAVEEGEAVVVAAVVMAGVEKRQQAGKALDVARTKAISSVSAVTNMGTMLIGAHHRSRRERRRIMRRRRALGNPKRSCSPSWRR